MSEEVVYHYGTLDIFFRDCIGNMDIVQDYFGPDLEKEGFERGIYIFILIVSAFSLYRPQDSL